MTISVAQGNPASGRAARRRRARPLRRRDGWIGKEGIRQGADQGAGEDADGERHAERADEGLISDAGHRDQRE